MALIYIVEDDMNIREIEMIALKNSNYIVKAFERASDFHSEIAEILPDLILLDIMLPDEDGNSIIRKLRSNSKTRNIPVLMVTAKTTELDLVKGFEDGADDYLRKPFSIMELISRVKALLRRTQSEEQNFIVTGLISLDHERRIVYVDGKQTDLTYKEYELLRYLMLNKELVMSRESIMRFVWGTDYAGETRTVDMHIKTLRQKLGQGGSQIKTIRNVGYVLNTEVSDEAKD